MKYWKGINTKEGNFGTFDDTGFVPDSVETTQEEYEQYVSSQPVAEKIKTLAERIIVLEAKNVI